MNLIMRVSTMNELPQLNKVIEQLNKNKQPAITDIISRLEKPPVSQGKMDNATTANSTPPVVPTDTTSLFSKIMDRLNSIGKIEYQRANVSEAVDNKREYKVGDDFSRGIIYAENRGTPEDKLYGVVGMTGDLGKYQVNPKVLKGWSKAWLGKEYNEKEFLNDPKAQEEFFKQYLAVVNRLQLTPEEAAVAWHRGWGELGTGDRKDRDERFRAKLAELMDEPESKKYLENFNKEFNKKNNGDK